MKFLYIVMGYIKLTVLKNLFLLSISLGMRKGQEGADVEYITIPEKSVSYGSEDVTVYHGQTMELDPGDYRDITVYDRGEIKLVPGDYNFREFSAGADVTISIDLSQQEGVYINADQKLHFSDRISIALSGNDRPDLVEFYTNQTGYLRIGTDTEFRGMLYAPNGDLTVYSRTNVHGALYADRVIIEPDAGTFESAEDQTPPPDVVITSPEEGYLTNESPIDVTWTVDGVDQTNQLTEDLVEGENMVIRSFTNQAGKTGADTVTATLDTTPPDVVIISPEEGFLTNETPVDVTWTVDGEEQTTDLTEELVEGENLVIRSATDEAGNTGADTVSVTLDITPPDVVITSPEEGYITDETPIDVTWTVDGEEQATDITEDLSEGENLVIRSATDAAGNTGADTVSVTLDTTPPDVVITSPEEGFLTNGTPIDVTWAVDGEEQTTDLTEGLSEGENIVVRSATDAAGNTGADTVSVTLDATPPDVVITSPEEGYITDESPIDVTWTVDGEEQTTDLTEDLSEGENLVIRSATDAAGNTGADTVAVTLGVNPPDVVITSPEDGFLTNETPIDVTWTVDGEEQTTDLTEGLSEGENIVVRSATDAAGNTGADTVLVTYSQVVIPPNPEEVAPVLDSTSLTSFNNRNTFLYTGDDPIQSGVSEGTIEDERIAVIKGVVLDRNNTPLTGVEVSIKDHPEFGSTFTREDGEFDLAVNGGGNLTISYTMSGYIDVHRKVEVPWRDYVHAPDIVMIQHDTKVTDIALGEDAPVQVAEGSVVSDDAGTRTTRLIFPEGIEIDESLSEINVRATEYTVGENGPEAMPAELPGHIGYTYCTELSVDGLDEVSFNKPVWHYVENFLDFPVGGAVPAGYYDRDKGAWVPSENGRVIEILGQESGLALIDVDGSGVPASDEVLSDMGFSDGERDELAQAYSAGETLWRVPIEHFSPWDCNWPFGPPEDAEPPEIPDIEICDDIDDPCFASGSIIDIQNQMLTEVVDVTGTPISLYYSSGRVPGRKDNRVAEITLSGNSIPSSVTSIVLEIRVAGQSFKRSFSPSTNLSYVYEWDGKDGYGRKINGVVPGEVKIGYVYEGVYQEPVNNVNNEVLQGRSFGNMSGVAVEGSTARQEITMWHYESVEFGRFSSLYKGFGGWTPDMLHYYDTEGMVLHLGNGNKRSAKNLCSIINTFAGTGVQGYNGDGGKAIEADLQRPMRVAADSKGNIYISDTENHVVRRVNKDGIIQRYAGTGTSGYSGDNGPALSARLKYPVGLFVTPGDTLYIASNGNHCIRKVTPEGIISTVAGTGSSGHSGDGGQAVMANLYKPEDVVQDNEGNLYIADRRNCLVRKVSSDGIITTIAGTGIYGYSGDGGPAKDADLSRITAIDIGPEGEIYIVDTDNNCIRKIGSNGIISTVAGTGMGGYSGDGGPAKDAELNNPYGISVQSDGSYYICNDSGQRIRKVGTDGIIRTVAGTGYTGYSGDGGPAAKAEFANPDGVCTDEEGNLYIADKYNNLIRKISSVMQGFSAGDIAIPSEDGNEIYQFDYSGKHLRTLDALTYSTIYEFNYNEAGYLVSIEDRDGLVTSIQRSPNGDPVSITGPYGEVTSLNTGPNGYLESIVNPAGETVSATYSEDGLMQTYTDPEGNTSAFTYDDQGRLIEDIDQVGGYTRLEREDTENGYTVTRRENADDYKEYVTTYTVERRPEGGMKYTTSGCCGGEVTMIRDAGGTETLYSPDSTVTVTSYGPDPRFGMQAPIVEEKTINLPSGLTFHAEHSRTPGYWDPEAKDSIKTLTDSITIDGDVFVTKYDYETRTISRITPEGRQDTTKLDSVGRVALSSIRGIEPVEYEYDDKGRLTKVSQGSGLDIREKSFGYNAYGRVSEIRDPEDNLTMFDYDASGRVTEKTLADGEEIGFNYDENSNVTAIIPPGKPFHEFDYTDVDELETYSPPLVGSGEVSTSYTYNLNRQIKEISRPDGSTIGFEYDDMGQVARVTSPSGEISYTYSDTTNSLTEIAAPDAVLSYTYDGSIVTGISWTGGVQGSIELGYNTRLQLSSMSFNSGEPVSYTYNSDGILTGAGDVTITSDPENGRLTGNRLGSVRDTLRYNSFGELSYMEAYANGAEIFSENITEVDRLGRITEKTETVNGVSHTYSYTYDETGQLVEVLRDGVVYSTYTYDSNGNRLSYSGEQGYAEGVYDDQDRLISYGNYSFEYNQNGDLVSKSNGAQTTHYEYDALGNLRSVDLPDGREIEYIIDGRNRRVGSRIDGSFEKGYIYKDQLNPVAETDAQGNIVSRFVYGAKSFVPEYMTRGGRSYKIVTDHLGSVRMVVDTETGEVMQRIEYDEFGRVLEDTNPGFQPFGFAGGLYDHRTGLVRFGARDYDAEIGRWTCKDPILFASGSFNVYVYCGNDPVNYVDRDGYEESGIERAEELYECAKRSYYEQAG